MFGLNHKAELEALEQQLFALVSERDTLKSKLESTINATHTFAEKEMSYQRKLNDSQKKLDNTVASHKLELRKVEDSVNRKVNATLASIGVQQFAAEQFSVPVNQTDLEVFHTFMNLPDDQKSEYYKKHKDQIIRVKLI